MTRRPQQGFDASIAAIARQTATSVDVVKALYEKELSALDARSRVKQYVSLIAMKRVRHQLLLGKKSALRTIEG